MASNVETNEIVSARTHQLKHFVLPRMCVPNRLCMMLQAQFQQ
jgi:hypothetical protein